jgi:hypothetical protein
MGMHLDKNNDWRGHAMRKYFIVFTIIAVFTILLIMLSLSRNSLSDRVTKYIDKNISNDNYCTLSMRDITKFKWDKMLIYQVGSSKKAISDKLGVEFQDSVDLMSGMVFVYNNKIVYKESSPYNPEKPSKLIIHVGDLFGELNNLVLVPDTAVFKCIKFEKDGKDYYEIMPLK